MFNNIKEWLHLQLSPENTALRYFWVLGVTHRHVMQIQDHSAMTYCPKCNGGILDPYNYEMAPCHELEWLHRRDEAVKILPYVDKN